MSSSETTKAETLSLTVEQCIQATQDYHHGVQLNLCWKHWTRKIMLFQYFT